MRAALCLRRSFCERIRIPTCLRYVAQGVGRNDAHVSFLVRDSLQVAVATRVVRDGLRPSIPPHVPPPVAEAMQQMWAAQANDRISLAEAEILVQRAMQQC